MSEHKAPTDLLEALHGKLAEALIERIKNGEATAADLNVARQFLKDNGVDAIAVEESPLDHLREALPFQSQEELKEELRLIN